ncbi:hypothetical protein jhhlp_001200 [Lomentospora prolificans]|uniref:SGNH hydrolase-type esterase domain-containing protein n=1 Tax=Lomentospora prolificans TaxID=41688 RepID=A0A2N3NHG6_9PEZI|nr:hypothetical protein jhhlp_001200 [Lomentospora prolificans]
MAKLYPQIVLFGDSLMQGTAEVQDGFSLLGELQHRVIRRYDVVNRGFSGYNTANALKLLPEIFAPASDHAPRIEYFFVLLGANDAVIPLPTTTQAVAIDKYKENLKKIVTHPIITSHKPKIFIIPPPPLDEIHASRRDIENGHPQGTRTAKVSAAYSETAREVAREVGVEIVDLYKAIMDKAIELTPGFDGGAGDVLGTPECGKQGGLELLLKDGLHMNGHAYRVFYEILKPKVEGDWAKAPEEERAGYVFPDWKLLNPPE